MPRNFAPYRHLHDVLHISDTEAVAREQVALQLNGEHGQAFDLLHLRLDHAGNARQHAPDFLRRLAEHIDVIAENLHRHVALHAGDQFVGAQLDRLFDFHARADHVLHRDIYFFDELLL